MSQAKLCIEVTAVCLSVSILYFCMSSLVAIPLFTELTVNLAPAVRWSIFAVLLLFNVVFDVLVIVLACVYVWKTKHNKTCSEACCECVEACQPWGRRQRL